MTARLILTAIMALCACPFALAADGTGAVPGAVEIELTYAESHPEHTWFTPLSMSLWDLDKWLEGDKVLTDRSLTFKAGGRLTAIDFSDKAGDLPDILYMDADRDRIIEADEKFALAPLDEKSTKPPGSYFNPLTPGRISFSSQSGAGQVTDYLNFWLLWDGTESHFSMWAWGCFKGNITLEGAELEVRLDDANANGSFADFSGEDDSDCDTLTLIDRKQATEETRPLRRLLLHGSRAYRVEVLDGGRRLRLEPVEGDVGSVAVPEDLMIEIAHAEWGTRYLAGGTTVSLPVGYYWISAFSRIRKEPHTICSYKGTKELKVRVVPGAVTTIEPETLFHAKVKASKSRFGKTMRLSLTMETSQGARFRGYDRRASSGEPALKGIPFFITDSKGNVVLDDMFEFG